MAGRLDGKVAVITGAASGIGLGAVERFIEDGALVLAADIQDEKGKNLEARFKGKLRYMHCDVTQEAEIKAAIDGAVAAFGGLDIVFNNAGGGGAGNGVEDADLAGWKSTYDLLLFSVVAGTKYATPHLKARGGGAIINTSSITALQAGYGPIAYSTAKAAVMHFSRLAAAELSQHKIRINAILPGFIATSIFGASLGMERPVADQMAALLAEKGGNVQPIGRVGEPRDIAAMAAFLASDDASFITGSHFVVDGGITIGPRSAWDTSAPSALLDALGISPEQAEAMRAAQSAKG
ncbi:MAG: SDR family oxidoreductase [Hyphomonadaceae bacterium]|nr:MAG: short-chain dehydrogenase/reductase SDR [Caulobacteraceae bacterium]MBT9444957.1 SDR family oxidoreductase [Hyphomonadaceae bacterium]